MTKIEPVSKAAARFFQDMCIGTTLDEKENNSVLYALFCVHVAAIPEEEIKTQREFAAFCRAVADQLDPSVYTANTNAQVCLSETIRRQCFRVGFDYARDESKVKILDMGIPYELPTEMIDNELKKQGLLGDQEND